MTAPFIRVPAHERTLAVVMTAANAINADLTIVINGADELREFEAGAEILAAAQRIIWQVSGLAQYCARRGGKARGVPVERLITEDV